MSLVWLLLPVLLPVLLLAFQLLLPLHGSLCHSSRCCSSSTATKPWCSQRHHPSWRLLLGEPVL